MSNQTNSDDKNLISEVRSLRAFLQDVHAREQWSNHPVKVTAISFIKGIAYGLGAIAAVAIVAPIVLWFLQAVSWPPIIAGFVTQITRQMEQASPRVPPWAGGL